MLAIFDPAPAQSHPGSRTATSPGPARSQGSSPAAGGAAPRLSATLPALGTARAPHVWAVDSAPASRAASLR